MLICPYFTLTFFAGTFPAETSPVVLLGPEHFIDSSSALSGTVSQLVQRADYVRGEVPGFFARGNRSQSLSWEQVRKIIDPAEALAVALRSAAETPAGVGWVRLAVPSQGLAWALSPVAVSTHSWSHDPKRGLLRLQWQLEAGPATSIAVQAPDFALTAETGFALATEDGRVLVTEAAS